MPIYIDTTENERSFDMLRRERTRLHFLGSGI